jgi:hypothetical protein
MSTQPVNLTKLTHAVMFFTHFNFKEAFQSGISHIETAKVEQ